MLITVAQLALTFILLKDTGLRTESLFGTYSETAVQSVAVAPLLDGMIEEQEKLYGV